MPRQHSRSRSPVQPSSKASGVPAPAEAAGAGTVLAGAEETPQVGVGTHKDEDEDVCPVCLDSCHPMESAILYRCTHRVHKDCAQKLLHSRLRRECPLCRAEALGVDANGNTLPPREDDSSGLEDATDVEEEEEEEDDDVESGMDEADAGRWLLDTVDAAFERTYGSSGGPRRGDFRELRCFAVLDFVNQARDRLLPRERPWRGMHGHLGQQQFLGLLMGSLDEVRLINNTVVLRYGNVLLLPEPTQSRPPPVPRWKVERLLQAAVPVAGSSGSSSSS